MNLWTRIEQARARTNVLEHPFYQRWSAGELTRSELTTYAGEYRHAVAALAEAAAAAARGAEPAIRAGLEAHAAEEASHLDLWDGFARALDADLAATPTPETEDCSRVWAGEGRDLLGSLVALYAIESGQPEISEVKRAGLREHYGLDAPEATAYFDLHAVLDREHAASARDLIEARVRDADVDGLVATAEAVLRANWRLLDGVERRNGR